MHLSSHSHSLVSSLKYPRHESSLFTVSSIEKHTSILYNGCIDTPNSLKRVISKIVDETWLERITSPGRIWRVPISFASNSTVAINSSVE